MICSEKQADNTSLKPKGILFCVQQKQREKHPVPWDSCHLKQNKSEREGQILEELLPNASEKQVEKSFRKVCTGFDRPPH